MKKLISSFAVIGVLALSLIGGPAMATTPSPSPTLSACPDVSIPEKPLPPCPTPTSTLIPVTPVSPTVKFDKCGAGGTVIPPVIEGIVYAPVMGSAGMHHISWSATALPGYVLTDSTGKPLPTPVEYYLATLAPGCPPAVVTPTPTATTTPTPTVAAVPSAPKPPAAAPVLPTELAYTGLDIQTLLIGSALTALGLLALLFSKRRTS